MINITPTQIRPANTAVVRWMGVRVVTRTGELARMGATGRGEVWRGGTTCGNTVVQAATNSAPVLNLSDGIFASALKMARLTGGGRSGINSHGGRGRFWMWAMMTEMALPLGPTVKGG